MNTKNEAGIIHSYGAIGAYLGIGEDAARRRAKVEGMPVVHDGRRVWIRKATLDAWLAEREAAARAAVKQGGR